MAEVDMSTAVGTLVANDPSLARVFEELRIDYCCHGNASLASACERHQLDPEQVLQRLNRSEGAPPDTRNWAVAPLTELCDHIEQTHHAYLRKELPRLDQLTGKVAEVHGTRYPKLHDVKAVFQDLQAELVPHMMKEEQILFPAIRQLEAASQRLSLPFGTVQNPIRMMEHEHDVAGNALGKLHELTNGYQIPRDACNTYCAMLQGLHELELDLHQHIHKENNILFPRAIAQEATLDV
jgi:regulator of cell morphogenesis and NO signaling